MSELSELSDSESDLGDQPTGSEVLLLLTLPPSASALMPRHRERVLEITKTVTITEVVSNSEDLHPKACQVTVTNVESGSGHPVTVNISHMHERINESSSSPKIEVQETIENKLSGEGKTVEHVETQIDRILLVKSSPDTSFDLSSDNVIDIHYSHSSVDINQERSSSPNGFKRHLVYRQFNDNNDSLLSPDSAVDGSPRRSEESDSDNSMIIHTPPSSLVHCRRDDSGLSSVETRKRQSSAMDSSDDDLHFVGQRSQETPKAENLTTGPPKPRRYIVTNLVQSDRLISPPPNVLLADIVCEKNVANGHINHAVTALTYNETGTELSSSDRLYDACSQSEESPDIIHEEIDMTEIVSPNAAENCDSLDTDTKELKRSSGTQTAFVGREECGEAPPKPPRAGMYETKNEELFLGCSRPIEHVQHYEVSLDELPRSSGTTSTTAGSEEIDQSPGKENNQLMDEVETNEIGIPSCSDCPNGDAPRSTPAVILTAEDPIQMSNNRKYSEPPKAPHRSPSRKSSKPTALPTEGLKADFCVSPRRSPSSPIIVVQQSSSRKSSVDHGPVAPRRRKSTVNDIDWYAAFNMKEPTTPKSPRSPLLVDALREAENAIIEKKMPKRSASAEPLPSCVIDLNQVFRPNENKCAAHSKGQCNCNACRLTRLSDEEREKFFACEKSNTTVHKNRDNDENRVRSYSAGPLDLEEVFSPSPPVLTQNEEQNNAGGLVEIKSKTTFDHNDLGDESTTEFEESVCDLNLSRDESDTPPPSYELLTNESSSTIISAKSNESITPINLEEVLSFSRSSTPQQPNQSKISSSGCIIAANSYEIFVEPSDVATTKTVPIEKAFNTIEDLTPIDLDEVFSPSQSVTPMPTVEEKISTAEWKKHESLESKAEVKFISPNPSNQGPHNDVEFKDIVSASNLFTEDDLRHGGSDPYEKGQSVNAYAEQEEAVKPEKLALEITPIDLDEVFNPSRSGTPQTKNKETCDEVDTNFDKALPLSSISINERRIALEETAEFPPLRASTPKSQKEHAEDIAKTNSVLNGETTIVAEGIAASIISASYDEFIFNRTETAEGADHSNDGNGVPAVEMKKVSQIASSIESEWLRNVVESSTSGLLYSDLHVQPHCAPPDLTNSTAHDSGTFDCSIESVASDDSHGTLNPTEAPTDLNILDQVFGTCVKNQQKQCSCKACRVEIDGFPEDSLNCFDSSPKSPCAAEGVIFHESDKKAINVMDSATDHVKCIDNTSFVTTTSDQPKMPAIADVTITALVEPELVHTDSFEQQFLNSVKEEVKVARSQSFDNYYHHREEQDVQTEKISRRHLDDFYDDIYDDSEELDVSEFVDDILSRSIGDAAMLAASQDFYRDRRIHTDTSYDQRLFETETTSENRLESIVSFPVTPTTPLAQVSPKEGETFVSNASLRLSENDPILQLVFANPPQERRKTNTSGERKNANTVQGFESNLSESQSVQMIPEQAPQTDHELLEVEVLDDHYVVSGQYRLEISKTDPLGIQLAELHGNSSQLDFAVAPKLRRLLLQCLREKTLGNSPSCLSSRAQCLVERDDVAYEMFFEMRKNKFCSLTNPAGNINFCTAENKICEDLLSKYIEEGRFYGKNPKITSYGPAGGYLEVKKAFLELIHEHGGDNISEHDLALIPSGNCAYDILSHCLMESQDVILTPTPTYARTFVNVSERAECVLEGVDMDMCNPRLDVAAFDKRYRELTEKGATVRAIVIINPGNPLGISFPKNDIIAVCDWAAHNNMCTIIDESFGQCVYGDKKFESYASYHKEIAQPEKTACFWTLSKDYGLPGVKISVLYTPNNLLHSALMQLELIHPVSALAQDFAMNFIKSDERKLLSEARIRRLRIRSNFVKDNLRAMGLSFIDADAGFFVFVDFRKKLTDQTFEAEHQFSLKMREKGIFMTPGSHTKCPEPGWMRLVFACDEQQLIEGLKRLHDLFGTQLVGSLECA